MNETIKQYMKSNGKKGGIKSASIRFSGMTKEQRSEAMRKIRYSKKDWTESVKHAKGLAKNLEKNVTHQTL